jgi:fluoroquinolone transport system permease protein
MTSLLSLLRWDLMRQVRHGFWLAAVFVMVPSMAVILSVSHKLALQFLPAFIFFELSVTGTLFIAAMFFFEKREGSLFAVAVTPVPTWQWLASKLVSLTLLGTVMSLALVALKLGLNAPWGKVLLASVCVNALCTLAGFLCAVPFDKFNDFFVAFAFMFLVLELPGLAFFGIHTPFFWLIPTQPTMEMLRHTFTGISWARFSVLLLLQFVWIAAAFALSLRAFRRFVSERKGG